MRKPLDQNSITTYATFRLPVSMLIALRDKAESRKKNLSHVIRELLAAGLDK